MSISISMRASKLWEHIYISIEISNLKSHKLFSYKLLNNAKPQKIWAKS